MKKVIVINGRGGVGKDTLCEFAAKRYKVMNISSITPIKELAMQIGWDGAKDLRSRKFLSDLKQLTSEYNDYPNNYLLRKCREFEKSEYELLFVHIRESEQIVHFIETSGCGAVTLLIRRGEAGVYGNASDDNVENYSYDLVYQNDLPLEEAESDFVRFLEEKLEDR